MADLAEAFGKAYKAARAACKADDRVRFVLKNWALFSCSYSHADKIRKELESRNVLSATMLLDSLGVPDWVMLTTCGLREVKKLLDDPLKSRTLDLARKNILDAGTIVLFVVSGAHSLAISSIKPVTVPGTTYQTVIDNDGTAYYILNMDKIDKMLPMLKEERQ